MPLNCRPAGLAVPQPAPHGDGDERRRGPQLHLRRPARPARQEGALAGLGCPCKPGVQFNGHLRDALNDALNGALNLQPENMSLNASQNTALFHALNHASNFSCLLNRLPARYE